MELLTKDEWHNFNGKQQWDIQVALRGPDCYYGETIKWYTTGVIRGKVQEAMRVGGTVNQYLNLVIIPKDRIAVSEGKKKRDWNCHHFVEHVSLAAQHLKIPILWISGELWHEAMQIHSAYTAGMSIYEAVKDQPTKYPKELVEELNIHLKMGRLHS